MRHYPDFCLTSMLKKCEILFPIISLCQPSTIYSSAPLIQPSDSMSKQIRPDIDDVVRLIVGKIHILNDTDFNAKIYPLSLAHVIFLVRRRRLDWRSLSGTLWAIGFFSL